MTLRHFENKARQSWWLIHIEAWRRSGLSRAKYCPQHGLTTTTFGRWLGYLVGKKEARKQRNIRRNCVVSSAVRLRKGAAGGAPAFASA